ncbi:MAG: mechanosensitive ion channel [Pseudomonadales bacterium]
MVKVTLFVASCVFANITIAQEIAPDIPDKATIDTQIERVTASTNLSETQKKQSIEFLQLALSRIDATAEQLRQANYYAAALASAASERAEFDAQAAGYEAPRLTKTLADAPLTELKARLERDQAELAALRNRSVALEASIQNERTFDIQNALIEARAQQLTARTVPDSVDAAQNAEEILATVTQAWQDARIEMLEQRLLSRDLRLASWEAELALTSKRISGLETTVAQLRRFVTDHRQSEARQTLVETENIASSLADEPIAVQQIADELVQRAKELGQLVMQHDEAVFENARIAREVRRLSQKYRNLAEQMELISMDSSPEFGSALRHERDLLADSRIDAHSLSEHEQQLTQSRLAQFRIDTLREEDVALAISSVMESLRLDPQVIVTAEREAVIQDLLARRQSLLAILSGAYASFTDELIDVITQSRLLADQRKEYATFLDEHLPWMKTADIMGLDTLEGLGSSVEWLVSADSWRRVAQGVYERLGQTLVATIFVTLLLVLLLKRRSRLIAALAATKDLVGKVHLDRISSSLSAMAITGLLAMPGPLTLALIGVLVYQPDGIAQDLARSILYGSFIFLVLEFLLQSVRSDGLIERHFKWNPVLAVALKENLPWFMLIVIPASVLTLFIENQADSVVRNSLGRITFIAATLALAVFTYRVLKPVSVAPRVAEGGISASNSWDKREVTVWLPVLMLLLVTVLSVYGFHYTAVTLNMIVVNSALVALLAAFSFGMFQRAFAIRERRLALDRIREKRASALERSKDRDAAEAAGEGVPTELDLQQIDAQTVSEQTNALLKMLVMVAVGLALWKIWSGFLPAFTPLTEFRLWDISEFIDGVPVVKAFTMWDLLLAVLLSAITFAAAKNIPGLLEIAVLSRMSLETGTGYAVTTVVRYIIVIFGSFVVLQTLGAQWSKLQWLIAALGVGLGFGLQEIVANFVSGLVLLFERPIRIGDTVTVGDQWGTVSRIRIRATTLVDWDRREIVIPNKTFITERLVNWTLTDPITRTTIRVGVAYGSDVDLTEKLLMEVATTNEKVLVDPPPAALFLGFGDSSLNFELRIFVKSIREIVSATHEIHVAIDKIFREHGIEIAFPQRDIHFDSKPMEVHLVTPDDKG